MFLLLRTIDLWFQKSMTDFAFDRMVIESCQWQGCSATFNPQCIYVYRVVSAISQPRKFLS